MNNVTLIGRLAADPELKKTASDIAVCSFTIAVSRGREDTDWIDCTAWRGTAEFICKYFTKGKPIAIAGALQTRMWEDKNGLKRKSVEVLVKEAEFVLSEKKEESKDDFTEIDSFDLPF